MINKNIQECEIDVKRFYLDGLDAFLKCPNCDEELDIVSNYLSYPIANKVFEHLMWCHNCDYEWNIKIKLNLSLEILENAD